VVHLDVRRMRLRRVDVQGDDADAGALCFGNRGGKRHAVDRLQEDDRGALLDEGVDEAYLHLDLVLAVEQLVVDGLLRLQHLLDPLRPRGRHRVRLPLDEGHLFVLRGSSGLRYAEAAARDVAEERRRGTDRGRAKDHALQEIAATAAGDCHVSFHVFLPLQIEVSRRSSACATDVDHGLDQA
jgi:hypothetical protein